MYKSASSKQINNIQCRISTKANLSEMSQEEQDCTKSLKEALSSSDKLNISVVGNIDSGKSLLENTLCEYLGDDAEHQSSERKAQGDRPLSIFAGEMLILSLIESMQPQRKNVRVTNKSLDSV